MITQKLHTQRLIATGRFNSLIFRNKHCWRQHTTLRRANTNHVIVSFLLPPALLGVASKIALRGPLPGKLLVNVINGRSFVSRLAFPITVALLAYSVAVTVYARRLKATTQQTVQEQPPTDNLPARNTPVETSSSAVSLDGVDASAGVCFVCGGKGKVQRWYEAEESCPLCLGKGFVSKSAPLIRNPFSKS